MYTELQDLEDIITQADEGDINGARDQLRHFTKHRPSTLLAWKWLADLAESPKERTAAIRRAQLLAPGDPWVIEAKKHRMPPKAKRRSSKKAVVRSPDTPNSVPSTKREVLESDLVHEESRAAGIGVTNSIGASEAGVGTPVSHDPASFPSAWIGRQQAADEKTDPLVWVSVLLGVSGFILVSVAWKLGAF